MIKTIYIPYYFLPYYYYIRTLTTGIDGFAGWAKYSVKGEIKLGKGFARSSTRRKGLGKICLAEESLSSAFYRETRQSVRRVFF